MREQIDELFSSSVSVAESLLAENGEYYPFAVAISAQGEFVRVEGWTEDSNPQSNDVIEVLLTGLRRGVLDGSYVSTALVSDVKLKDQITGEQSDAIQVDIEDREAEPIRCYVPYRIENGSVVTTDVIRVAGESAVFEV